MPIPAAATDAALEPWQPEGVTIHEGDPRGRGFTIHERTEGGHFLGVYLFECEPARTSYVLECTEIVHVLEGEVEITLDDGSTVELSAGGVAVLPKGQTSHWWFKTRFRELAVVTGYRTASPYAGPVSIEDAIRRVAESLREQAPAIAANIHERLIADVPEYYESGDPAILDVDLRSIAAALREIFDGLSHGRTPPDRASGTAVEEARTAAQAGIDLQALLRTYRVAQAVCQQAILEETEKLVDVAETRLAVLTLATRYQFEWNDRVMATLVDVYQQERDSLVRDRERQKRELVRDLLAGLPVDTSRIAYNLRGDHVAAIAWGASGDAALQRLARLLEGELMTVTSTAGALFGWVGGQGIATRLPAAIKHFDAPESTFVALGEAASGLDGFRTTHRQAQQAYRVAHVKPEPLTLYRDVSLEALVARDLQLVRDFLAYELGPIANADHRDTVLRETLKAYFRTGQNAASAAHLLGVHERTVAYRLRSVEQRLGVPVSARRDELAIALRLVELLRASEPGSPELGQLLALEDTAPPSDL